LRIDPRAKWSDGVPITADDFVFSFDLQEIYDQRPGPNVPRFVKVDSHTMRIENPESFGDYLPRLGDVIMPLHYFATGKFKNIFIPSPGSGQGEYDPALAQELVTDPLFTQPILPVSAGPFLVKQLVPGEKVVLVPNPYYVSNYLHRSALDQVTVVSVGSNGGALTPTAVKTVATAFQRGAYDDVEGLEPLDLPQLGGVPGSQIVSSPDGNLYVFGFNQRAAAPNAQANHGVSIFSDLNVRKAFVEAFDRCAAIRLQLRLSNCDDPRYVTNELTMPPAPDYDPKVAYSPYNPTDAQALLDAAGYHVVNGARRYQDGVTPIQLSVSIDPEVADATIIATRMAQDFEKNLKIAVRVEATTDTSTYLGEVGAGAFDVALYLNQGALEPTQNFANTFFGSNFVGVTDKTILSALATAQKIQDPSQVDTLFRNLMKYVAGQYVIEPLFIDTDVALVKPTLCNYKKFTLAGGLNLWNMTDWYVARSCQA
jgi:ABC-type transport system substrate-binding protein